MQPDVDALTKALSNPFDPTEVRFKPAVVSGNRALALAYVDARTIQDRLDDVLGVGNWQDDYECLADGSVVCRLRLRLGDEWITKVDVGGPSEQPDGGDRLKAAFSDALKRAAVKFGIGRYLYRLPAQWCDYDPQRKQFVRTPGLPASALPRLKSNVEPPCPAPPSVSNEQPKPAIKMSSHTIPVNGAELQRRLLDYDKRLAAQGLCGPGELVKYVVDAGVKAANSADLTTWTGPSIVLAVQQTKAFETLMRRNSGGQKEVA